MAEERRVRAAISGRVQGVFFRASLQETAALLGLAGWARNTADGRVEAELQGDPEAVGKALEFCREGPPAARVERVDVADLEPIAGAVGFSAQ